MSTIIRNSGGAGKNDFSLSISVPTGVESVTVTRTASGIGDDDLLGEVTASDIIYTGDVLETSAVASLYYTDAVGLVYGVNGHMVVTVTAGRQVSNMSFADATWDDVKDVADFIRRGDLVVQTASSGYKYVTLGNEVWSVGDTKTITGIGDVRVVDFQHWNDEFDLAQAGYGNTDAINMELLTPYAKLQHDTESDWTGTWDESLVYTALNSTFYELLPTDFSDKLLNVTVRSAFGTTDADRIITTDGKCNFASHQELVASYAYAYDEQCHLFNYYSVNDDDSYRIKYYDSAAITWWSRSPGSFISSSGSGQRRWAYVTSTGGLSSKEVSSSTSWAVPVFSY